MVFSILTRAFRLPQPAKLNLFDEKSFQDYAVDESAYKNDVFNEINALEASAYRAKSTYNHFEELIQWTLEGKLWKFPINNEQGIKSNSVIDP